jgi:BirA family biotin operon repressor/biotin-[acetyl-CoA-carboxylase] ligase
VRAAVAEALAARGVTKVVRVKWPNDVVVDELKVAGILVESQMRGEKLGAVVVGVGLNTGRLELPPDVQVRATSLAALGASVTREELLHTVLTELEARLARLEDRASLAALVTELSAHDALLGERVTVGELEGTASGIDELGNLKVLDATGRTHSVTSGHVMVKGWAERAVG